MCRVLWLKLRNGYNLNKESVITQMLVNITSLYLGAQKALHASSYQLTPLHNFCLGCCCKMIGQLPWLGYCIDSKIMAYRSFKGQNIRLFLLVTYQVILLNNVMQMSHKFSCYHSPRAQLTSINIYEHFL